MSAPRKTVEPHSLLGRAWLPVAAAGAMAWFARPGAVWEDALPLLAFTLLVALLRLAVAVFQIRGDPVLLAAGVFLAGLGVVVQARLGTLVLRGELGWSAYALPGGLVVMVLIALLFRQGRVQALQQLAVPAALAAAAVLCGLLLAGRRFRGGVYLEGNINPSEIVKVLLVLYLAGLFTVHRKAFEKPAFPGVPALNGGLLFSLAVCWAMPMGLLVLVRDTGMIVLLNAVFLIMAVLASGRWSYLVTGMLLAAAAGAALLVLLPHGGGRVAVWRDPFADPTGRGWQVLQSLSAMNSGGLWGAGLGAGQPQSIPIAASDFVYAALAEELGYVGCGLVLAVYLLFFYRGFRLADSLRDPFSQSLATGITALFAVQTLLNLGGVTKAIPLTGITLPFISHGGSSLVTSLALLGLLLALSEPARGKR